MTQKVKTIKLKYIAWTTDGTNKWKVENITNSVEFTPGQHLTKEEVDELCHSKQWEVSVT